MNEPRITEVLIGRRNTTLQSTETPRIPNQHFNVFHFTKSCCPLLTTLLSGSPILQNGRLVGAVTHVLIGDPTTGYGIFVENMLANIPEELS